MRTAAALLLALGSGCAEPVPPPRAEVGPMGLELVGEDISKVVLLDPDGVPVLTRRSPEPADAVSLSWLWEEPGTWTAEVHAADGVSRLPLEIAAALPVAVELEAPAGQDPRPLADGDEVELPLVEGHPAEVALGLAAARGGALRVRWGEAEAEEHALGAGERLVLRREVGERTRVELELAGERLSFTLLPRAVSLDELGQQLRIEQVTLPATRMGSPDIGRPADRVSLPSRWWRSLTRSAGLGVRARDPWAPWSWVGVTLHNAGEEPVNLVLRLRVLDEQGQPAPAFAPRLREGSDGSGVIRALLRVPPGRSATAALPLFVDEGLLSSQVAAEQHWERVVDVAPLGSPVAVLEDRAPLYASRGSTAASLGLVGALLAAVLGTGLLLRSGPVWLRRARTSELMTISLFGAMTFLVGAVGRLLTMGLATVLGPFATLLTGLVDDCLRYGLLATLLVLLPRPGTAALAVLVGWLLSGFAMGTFSPTDLLFVGGRVFWLEACLWLAGITRSTGWREQGAVWRWLRLSLGLGGASVLTSATGLVLHIVLYRLFYAGWYVALMLALPGFLYVCLAAALAVPFADSLRRIQR